MTYNYAVSCTVEDEEGHSETRVVGIRYHKQCNTSMLKIFIKKMISCNKKNAVINIAQVENISEEESLKRFGNKLLCPSRVVY